jgi:hypothetical protein
MVGEMGVAGAAALPSGGVADSVVEDVEDDDTVIRQAAGRSGNWYGYSEAGTVTLDPMAVQLQPLLPLLRSGRRVPPSFTVCHTRWWVRSQPIRR